MTAATKPAPAMDPELVPRLENGDHLGREEFERRYRADPALKKAELIDAVVYLPSPVRHRQNSKPHSHFNGWLVRYVAATAGVESGDNDTLRLDWSNELQPDAYLLILPACGGQSVMDEEDDVLGAPELIAEIAASSVSYDLHVKLRVYQRSGVKEYVVWRVEDGAIDWFVRRGELFEPMPPGGIYQSTVFPGLWLDPQALIAGDLAKVFQVLDQGLAYPEHAAFVSLLQERLKNPPKRD
jgi:Uma2 family endonuclease